MNTNEKFRQYVKNGLADINFNGIYESINEDGSYIPSKILNACQLVLYQLEFDNRLTPTIASFLSFHISALKGETEEPKRYDKNELLYLVQKLEHLLNHKESKDKLDLYI